MSLLDDPIDTVLLYREVATTDADGNPMRGASTSAVRVRGRVQPLNATENAALGQEVDTVYRFICRSLPKGGAFAQAQWQGRRWDVMGEPMRRNGSPTTAHVTVYLKARAPEVL